MLGTHSSSVGFVEAVGPEEKSQSLWARKENVCGSLWAPSMAADRCQSLVPPGSSTLAAVLSQLSFSAWLRMTNSRDNPFKYKHGRILLVTLCHKKVWICVCMNLYVYEFLHHLFPFLRQRVRFLSPLLSSKQVHVILMSTTMEYRLQGFFLLEHINTWAQVYQCNVGRNLLWL